MLKAVAGDLAKICEVSRPSAVARSEDLSEQIGGAEAQKKQCCWMFKVPS